MQLKTKVCDRSLNNYVY